MKNITVLSGPNKTEHDEEKKTPAEVIVRLIVYLGFLKLRMPE